MSKNVSDNLAANQACPKRRLMQTNTHVRLKISQWGAIQHTFASVARSLCLWCPPFAGMSTHSKPTMGTEGGRVHSSTRANDRQAAFVRQQTCTAGPSPMHSPAPATPKRVPMQMSTRGTGKQSMWRHENQTETAQPIGGFNYKSRSR